MAHHAFSTEPYDQTRYSVFDIKKSIEESGYKTSFSKDGLVIEKSDVSVDFPLVDTANSLVFADIRMRTHASTFDPIKNKKIFENLKRKFALEKIEYPNKLFIKDADKIEELKRSMNKKSWQFWK